MSIISALQAKTEAAVNREILGAVLSIILESSQQNAEEVRLVANSFHQMAADFEKMANMIDERNQSIASALEQVAASLDQKADKQIRKSLTRAFDTAAAQIRGAISSLKKQKD